MDYQAKLNELNSHKQNKSNPHETDHTQIIGLEYLDNTSDANKPVSIALQTELDKKFSVSDVVDNVTTDNAAKALSANQGKVISENLTQLNARVTDCETDV